jgi:glycosyl transferase family 25
MIHDARGPVPEKMCVLVEARMQRIDRVVYINLDRRTDRRAEMEAELARLRLPAWERFSAVEHHHGRIGCTLSHLAVLQRAQQEGWGSVLILEDDFIGTVTPEAWEDNLAQFFAVVPQYDVLMLSYNLLHGTPHNAVVGRVQNAQTTAGYLVHRRFYGPLMATMQAGLRRLQLHPHAHSFALDIFWKRVQPSSQWFYLLHRLGKQRASYSDIEHRVVDYGV